MGSAGNADGGCFHSRFQSHFYVQSQVFRQHCERCSKIFRTSKVLRNVWNYYANPNHSELGNHSEISEFFYAWRATDYDANCRQDYKLTFHSSNLLCFAVPLFSKPILTKQNIASTEITYQFLAPKGSCLEEK